MNKSTPSHLSLKEAVTNSLNSSSELFWAIGGFPYLGVGIGRDAGRFILTRSDFSRRTVRSLRRIEFMFRIQRGDPGSQSLRCSLLFVCTLSGLAARAQFVQHDGQDDDRSLDDQLPIKGDVHQSKSVIKYGDDQSPD